MDDDYISSGRAISDMKAHLVLTTKYRLTCYDRSNDFQTS
jgi:hypothetical protein